jgi:hypothetical protein
LSMVEYKEVEDRHNFLFSRDSWHSPCLKTKVLMWKLSTQYAMLDVISQSGAPPNEERERMKQINEELNKIPYH